MSSIQIRTLPVSTNGQHLGNRVIAKSAVRGRQAQFSYALKRAREPGRLGAHQDADRHVSSRHDRRKSSEGGVARCQLDAELDGPGSRSGSGGDEVAKVPGGRDDRGDGAAVCRGQGVSEGVRRERDRGDETAGEGVGVARAKGCRRGEGFADYGERCDSVGCERNAL